MSREGIPKGVIARYRQLYVFRGGVPYGPYWYLLWNERRPDGRYRSRAQYLGKTLPPGTIIDVPPERPLR